MNDSIHKLYKRAYLLSFFTIIYNIMEGVVSVVMGYKDETLTLSGFGLDSFIEVMSAVGIAVMIRNVVRKSDGSFTVFEKNALIITGSSFYLLSAGLFTGIIVSLTEHHKPETTIPGIIISLISIAVMYWLMIAKRNTGRELSSEPILADANCTMVCIYMSVVLLISSLVYEFTGFAYSDSIGAAGLIYFSINEGREAFEKAKSRSL